MEHTTELRARIHIANKKAVAYQQFANYCRAYGNPAGFNQFDEKAKAQRRIASRLAELLPLVCV